MNADIFSQMVTARDNNKVDAMKAVFCNDDITTAKKKVAEVNQFEESIKAELKNYAPEGVDPALFADCVNLDKLSVAIQDTAFVNFVKNYLGEYLPSGTIFNSFGLACALYDEGMSDFDCFYDFKHKLIKVALPALIENEIIEYVPTMNRHGYSEEYDIDNPAFAFVRFSASAYLYRVK